MKSNMDLMKTEAYDYYLPENLIAQEPACPRDSARMLVYDRNAKTMDHKVFSDIADYFNKGDVLVLNNTRVIPARLMGSKKDTHASIEVLLLKQLNHTDWEVLMKPGKRAKIGTIIEFGDLLKCEVLSDTDFGGKIVKFIFEGVFEEILDKLGSMPLPPYIKNAPKGIKEEYNTVFAKHSGSAAAPTAGLHFTPELLQKLEDKGVTIVEVLLHVGLGTFRPVKEDDITKHPMHTEYYEVTEEAANIINTAKKSGNRVIACGTTSVRTLESSTNHAGELLAQKGNTNIFIYPGYKYKIVDGLITNFHLPKSTLLMLVSAFMGRDEAINMYEEAVKREYKFFSFGDATFII